MSISIVEHSYFSLISGNTIRSCDLKSAPILFFRTMNDDSGAYGAGETIIEFDTSIDTATNSMVFRRPFKRQFLVAVYLRQSSMTAFK